MEYYYSILDYFPYVIIFIVVCIMELSAFNNKFKSKFIYYVLLLFTILRYNVGWDYEMYKNAVLNANIERFEPLSKLIFIICSAFNFYPLVFFVYGFSILYLTKIAIEKYSSNYVISWVVHYISFLFFSIIINLTPVFNNIFNFIFILFCFQKKNLPIFYNYFDIFFNSQFWYIWLISLPYC